MSRDVDIRATEMTRHIFRIRLSTVKQDEVGRVLRVCESLPMENFKVFKDHLLGSELVVVNKLYHR